MEKAKTEKAPKDNVKISTGRRKTSVARVRLVKGTGQIIINDKPINEYFPAGNFEMIVRQPLEVVNFQNDQDLLVKVHGGGLTGQAGAVRHGISRALVEDDEKNRPSLKANGFLTRDSRMVERKKYGQKKARKKFQFSKR